MIQRFVAAFVLALAASLSFAQSKELKIGVIYDLTGPFAAGGSYAGYLGNKYAIDMMSSVLGMAARRRTLGTRKRSASRRLTSPVTAVA